ncbi:U-box domain-containing protein 33 isoform X1 [Daucus carota subsp. sativus]|uniref:U-box domain-containing protein 33 isoform X1 n=1 Tax=Daucus carota subsp. sativus TaxID=79200 RepID=UPI0007F00F32|nr:PREDICTED: U-box domain-containing protein 33 isoform X1 [Daucus carota subsp. sativus]
MTLTSLYHAVSHSMIRVPDIALKGLMDSRGDIVEEIAVGEEEMVYVSVSKNVKESESTLKWAVRNFHGKKLCILHVHQPSKKKPSMGTKYSFSRLKDHQARTYHDTERQHMQSVLETYGLICERAGVWAETLHIEMDSIEKGIVELISMNNIRRLVMGAAADKLYSKKMIELKSKKAIYVCQKAPMSCHIWFVCNGNLIYTRRGDLDKASGKVFSPPPPLPSNCHVQSSSPRQSSGQEWRCSELAISASQFPKVRSAISSQDASGGTTPSSSLNNERNLYAWDNISRSDSADSFVSPRSSIEVVENSSLLKFSRPERSRNGIEFRAILNCDEGLYNSSPPSAQVCETYQEEIASDKLYDELEKTMAEAENSRQKAFEETIKCRKAEKRATEAILRAKASESSFTEELKQKKELEEALASGKEEIEKLKPKLDEIMKELQFALEQKSSLEFQIRDSNETVQELEQKIFSAVHLLQRYKKERDELLVERDNAVGLAEGLKKNPVEDTSIARVTQFYTEFSLSEIEAATHGFNPSLKIGEGGYGNIYAGILRHTQVAVKVPHSNSLQGPLEFEQEVNVLSTLRHPNLVTLIGACSEARILVYEYLPNGSLEDRLNCKENTPPLSWQTRVRIAAELCSVLVFLHSCKPRSIIHGDLKPSNILLDTNHVSKLSDFGTCSLISRDELSSNNTTICCRPDYAKGTFPYIDPEYLSTGELTRKSDVYSFGIILLRLLTGRPALGIAKDVQSALDKGNLKDLLDCTAGDWPFVRAKQLAQLALSCCEMSRNKRPELISEVWRMLEPMKFSCGASSFKRGSEDHLQIPHFYMCPIFQEIMQDPVVAADGYTYETEAIKGWLESGNDKSPMTDRKLANDILVPNHALRSAIQEWLQKS